VNKVGLVFDTKSNSGAWDEQLAPRLFGRERHLNEPLDLYACQRRLCCIMRGWWRVMARKLRIVERRGQ
jgi:hypothetical protein